MIKTANQKYILNKPVYWAVPLRTLALALVPESRASCSSLSRLRFKGFFGLGRISRAMASWYVSMPVWTASVASTKDFPTRMCMAIPAKRSVHTMSEIARASEASNVLFDTASRKSPLSSTPAEI